MKEKKQKKKGIFLKTSKQKEGLGDYEPSNGKGLKLQWLNFIAAYIKNGGNATGAYQTAYPEASKETARRNGSRLLTQADIISEINDRYDQQTATEAWVIASAMKYVSAGLEDTKFAYAGVKALELIAKSKGLLTDMHKVEFTAENPAVFMPLYSKEEMEKFKAMEKSGQRIIE